MKHVSFDLTPADLKQAREDLSLSVQEAADKLGITRGFLYNLEKGIKHASYDMLSTICRVYGIKFVIDENTSQSWPNPATKS